MPATRRLVSSVSRPVLEQVEGSSERDRLNGTEALNGWRGFCGNDLIKALGADDAQLAGLGRDGDQARAGED